MVSLGCNKNRVDSETALGILKVLVYAAILAAQILAVEDVKLAARLDDRRKRDADTVLEKDADIMKRL